MNYILFSIYLLLYTEKKKDIQLYTIINNQYNSYSHFITIL